MVLFQSHLFETEFVMKQSKLNHLLSGRCATNGRLLCAIAIAFAALFVLRVPVFAQKGTSKVGTLPNIVLIHGAWADGSSWSGVIQRLQAKGYTVTAPQLPLSSLDNDVARVREVLAPQTGPTLLVAHSFGGSVITELGKDAPNVVGLVYVSAFAPDKGETMKQFVTASPAPAGAIAIRPDKQGYLWLDPAGVLKFFAPDVDPVQAKIMASTQQPIAASEFTSEVPFGDPAWKSFPTSYIITEDDQMVPPQVQHFFAQRMGATVTSIKGSHASMVSHPDEVTNAILAAAQAVSTK